MNDPSQLELVPAPPTLTPRQAEALAHLQAAGHDGLTGQELARLLYPDAEFPRTWGFSLLRGLKKKGLVSQHRNGIWRAINAPDNTALLPGMTDVIPF